MSDIIERLHAATSSEPTVDEALRGPWLYAEAAAEITRLRAERDALAAESSAFGGAIIAHNIECQRACGEGDQEAVACGYRPYFEASGRRCSTCPTQYMIDTVHKAMQKVRPLTSDECQKLHEADTWCDLDSAFIAIMAARGIEVGE